MIENVPTNRAPSCANLVADPETCALNRPPILVDGKLLYPAHTVSTGNESGARNHVLLILTEGAAGLFMAWTPEGAREFAAAMVRGADAAEAELATKTTAALAAALNREIVPMDQAPHPEALQADFYNDDDDAALLSLYDIGRGLLLFALYASILLCAIILLAWGLAHSEPYFAAAGVPDPAELEQPVNP